MLTPHRGGAASGDGPAKAQGGISAGRRHISREAAYQPGGGMSVGTRVGNAVSIHVGLASRPAGRRPRRAS